MDGDIHLGIGVIALANASLASSIAQKKFIGK